MEFLHEELRRARETAGLSQQALADLAGIPRNQVVRAERGENITVETLRKIVVHLPVTQLTLLDTKGFRVDIIPEPEHLFIESVENVLRLTEALRAAIRLALAAGKAVQAAHRDSPLEGLDEVANFAPVAIMHALEQLDGDIDAATKAARLAS